MRVVRSFGPYVAGSLIALAALAGTLYVQKSALLIILILSLCFLVLASLHYHHKRGSLNKNIALEYLIMALATVVIFIGALRR